MRALAIDQRMARLGFGLRTIPGLEAAWLSRFPYGLGRMDLPADGTAMGTWTDLSGKGRDLTQATSANQPLWKFNGGIPGMQFDGVNDFLQTVSFAGWPETTIYAVVTPLSSGTGGQRIITHSDSTANTGIIVQTPYVSSAIRPDWITGTTSAMSRLSASSVPSGTLIIMSAKANATHKELRINGGVLNQADVTYAPIQSGALRVGASQPGFDLLSGLIHDLIICSQAHDDATRKRVEAALAKANGVTLAA